MSLDMEQVVLNMTVKEQRKLYRYVAQWITDEDAQRVIDHLAEMVKDSRAEVAVRISRGEWPVKAPLPRATVNRFIDAMPKNILEVCKVPTFIEDEKE